MLYKLLKHKISKNQLLGFTIANLIGLSIVFIGLQAYSDIKSILSNKESFLQDEYIVLTKKVSTLNSITGQSPSFSPSEIAKIKKQSFIADVGLFEASQFNLQAKVNFIGKQFGITTDLFFEAVPDDFLDIENSNWSYQEGDEEIPIIIPRSYLDLYNFGFATSKRLPKVSENLINSIRLHIVASGNGKTDQYKGKIVGFTKRLNTILVPEVFLKEANRVYAKQQDYAPERVIIKVKNSSDPQLSEFIKSNNYLIDGNQLDTGKARYFLNLSISIVLFIGLLISILSCYILILSIYLLVEKNIYSLENLALLGYSSRQIAKPYLVICTSLISLTTVLALMITFIAQYLYIPFLSRVHDEIIHTGLSKATWIFAILLFIAIVTISFIIIARKIRSITTFDK